MYPPKFDFQFAASLDQAVALLQQNPNAKVIAGGHSLLPALKLRLANPSMLIDIGRLGELKGISRQNHSNRIGALTTHTAVASSTQLPAALTEAAAQIGDPAVRNRGTVGGNVAHADPASDLPTVFMALDAKFHIAGPNGERSVDADQFFIDLFATALEESEILTAIEIPALHSTGSAYSKLANPASRYAILGAAAVIKIENGVCTQASVAVGGLTPKAIKAPSVEAALMGTSLDAQSIEAAAKAVADDLGDEVMGDIHASANYRRSVAPVYVARALTKAAERNA